MVLENASPFFEKVQKIYILLAQGRYCLVLDRKARVIVKLKRKQKGGAPMENMDLFARLPEVLLPWYNRNKRDLPWRANRNPYHIWVSEIMLQQTRVEAVKGYYERFIAALPTVADLASVDDELLHKLWEGLGYYSRVRNLKKAAGVIIDRFEGKFPSSYEDVLSLPGIGEYTAGAICSIAYGMPTPAVDGNVLRVISRLTNDDSPIDKPAFKKAVYNKIAAVYPPSAGDFTQALMELGATICGPNKKPDCENCPCNGFCLGFKYRTAEKLPVKMPKRQRAVEERTVFILSCDGYYALQKRPEKGLLAGLWEFPNTIGKLELPVAIKKVEQMGAVAKEILRTVERKHVFTHIEWRMRGVYIEVKEKNSSYIWMTAKQIEDEAALPTAFRQFWEEIPN